MSKFFYDAGVYAIRSKKNGGVYVGASAQLELRMNEHLRTIVSGKSRLKTIRVMFADHTEKDLEFEILERVEIERSGMYSMIYFDKGAKPCLRVLNERERVWIRKLKTCNILKRTPRVGVDVEVIDRTAVA